MSGQTSEKGKHIHIMLEARDRDDLRRLAAEHGMNVHPYVRSLIMSALGEYRAAQAGKRSRPGGDA